MNAVCVLGPVEAWTDSRRLALGGPQQVKLFAFLVLHANRAVSADALIDAMWGAERDGALKRLQMAITRLRRGLEPLDTGDGSVLRTVSSGYLLSIAPGELDVDVFEERVRAGRRALVDADPERASELLGKALVLWRGPPLAEVAFEDFAQLEIRRLEELRLVALEVRIEADLQLGRHAQKIGELEGLLAAQPTREGLARQLMLALYRSGRQAEALSVYRRIWGQLADELGLEPGPELRALHEDILRQAPSLRAPSTGPSALAEHGEDTQVENRALPRARTLIGREREIEEIRALMTDQELGLVTLAGTGGAGKTALALLVAREIADCFPDGVTVVWLANISEAGQVLPELARRLGIDLRSRETAVETLVRVLRFQRRLIVLDNFEHVLDAAPALSAVVAGCDHLKVLVTSRAPLRVLYERAYGLDGLALPGSGEAGSIESLGRWPATALFLERARAADRSFDPAPDSAREIVDLCQYLGGLPLALELAAARTGMLAPRQILDRLQKTPESTGSARRDAPERHRTLQATIDWSFNLLTPEQQRLFAMLGVFVGGFTLDAAETVAGDSAPEALDGLATLLDHGLLRRTTARGDPRLAMLEPIREYALRRLREENAMHRSALARYAEYYAELAEAAGRGLESDGQVKWLDVLDDELGNLRAVLALPDPKPQLDLALRVAVALSSFWDMRDLLAETRAWLRWALGEPPGDRRVRTRARAALGFLAWIVWDYDEGMTTLVDCLPALDKLGDAALTARCEAFLAMGFNQQGDHQSATAHADRAIRLAAETGDLWVEAQVMRVLGLATNSFEIAYGRVQRAIKVYGSVGDRLWTSHMKGNLGWRAVTDGDYDYARRISEEAAVEGHGIWGASHNAQVESTLGHADLFQGRHRHARQHLSRALALSWGIGWWMQAWEALTGLATVAAIEGRTEHGMTLAMAANTLCDTPPISGPVLARLNDLSNGLIDGARDQPRLRPQQVDAIVRDASREQSIDEPAVAPGGAELDPPRFTM